MRFHETLLIVAISLSASLVSSRADDAPREPFRISDVFDFKRHRVAKFLYCQANGHLFVSFAERGDDAFYEWDLDQKAVVHTYHVGEGYGCDHILLSPDGNLLVAGCWPVRGTTCKTLLFDTKDAHVVRDLEVASRIAEARFDKTGARIWIKTLDHPG
jgi:hypothetical protein